MFRKPKWTDEEFALKQARSSERKRKRNEGNIGYCKCGAGPFRWVLDPYWEAYDGTKCCIFVCSDCYVDDSGDV